MIPTKSIILLLSALSTGLSAGLFYAWQVSVIPGTKKVSNAVYLEAMQSINREILNPSFFLIFFGSIGLLLLGSIYSYGSAPLAFKILIAASLSYLIGTIGVTGLGNVPLNNQLDSLALDQLTKQELSDFRIMYEAKWNKFHLIRTLFSIAAFALSLWALLIQTIK